MRERLDVILVGQGYALSREKAKEMIRSGNVHVNGRKETKAGAFYEADQIQIEVREKASAYVSRGGLKLERAVEVWKLTFQGMVCMDVGASTGGFTDCMLQNGAGKVYAVDVGHGQLAQKLLEDSRVVNKEQTNFRYVVWEDIGEKLDFIGADVAFISLTKILIPARKLLKAGGRMVCRIKPQFEAGKGKVGKKGVVREVGIHREVISKIVDFADMIGFHVCALEESPILGPEGNREYLLLLKVPEEHGKAFDMLTEEAAEKALAQLMGEKRGLSCTSIWEQIINRVTVRPRKASAEM